MQIRLDGVVREILIDHDQDAVRPTGPLSLPGVDQPLDQIDEIILAKASSLLPRSAGFAIKVRKQVPAETVNPDIDKPMLEHGAVPIADVRLVKVKRGRIRHAQEIGFQNSQASLALQRLGIPPRYSF